MNTRPRGWRLKPLDHSPQGLKYALDKSGRSAPEVADALGVSKGFFYELLRGTRNAKPALLLRIAEELNCPLVVIEAKRDPLTGSSLEHAETGDCGG
jgi:transcriptional regulator with XRE-family HTH domain